jgi:hypothetical protein
MLPLFISGFFAAKIIQVIGGVGWTRFLSKRLSDSFISKKINENLEKVIEKIKDWYFQYRWNMFITIILNSLIIGISLISHYFFQMNEVIICIISSICIIMIIRMIVRFLKLLICTVIPNWSTIIYYADIFLINIFGHGYGIKKSIRDTIHVFYSNLYYANTNNITRGAHTVLSKLRFVKSNEEISEDVQDAIYKLITGYTICVIKYKIMAFFVYCAVFIFVLKPFVFSYTINMNVFQVIFYPFAIAIPKIIGILWK